MVTTSLIIQKYELIVQKLVVMLQVFHLYCGIWLLWFSSWSFYQTRSSSNRLLAWGGRGSSLRLHLVSFWETCFTFSKKICENVFSFTHFKWLILKILWKQIIVFYHYSNPILFQFQYPILENTRPFWKTFMFGFIFILSCSFSKDKIMFVS